MIIIFHATEYANTAIAILILARHLADVKIDHEFPNLAFYECVSIYECSILRRISFAISSFDGFTSIRIDE